MESQRTAAFTRHRIRNAIGVACQIQAQRAAAWQSAGCGLGRDGAATLKFDRACRPRDRRALEYRMCADASVIEARLCGDTVRAKRNVDERFF